MKVIALNGTTVRALGATTALVLGSTLFSAAPSYASGGTNAAVSDYLYGLKYDKEQLLAYQGETVSNIPPTQTEEKNGQFIVVSKEKKALSSPSVDIAVTASDDRTFPGAVLQANAGLMENNPTLISARRSPAVLSVDLPGMSNGDNSIVVTQPSTSSVRSGINTLLDRWNSQYSLTYPNIPAKIQYSESMAYSLSQLKVNFGLSFEKVAKPLDINFSAVSSGDKQIQIVNFKQIYYTVSMDAPENPGDVFASEVTPQDLQSRGVSDSTPPVYVSNVAYGRSMYIKLETSSKSDKVTAAFSAAIKGVDVRANAELQHILDDTSFTAVILGGNAGLATTIVGAKPDGTPGPGIGQLDDIIQEGALYGKLSPGVPISYSTSFLKDNTPAVSINSSEYIQTKATAFNNGSINLDHSGAYVARFQIHWDELGYDSSGQPVMVAKSWDGNNQDRTAHFSTTIPLKGNARNLRIQAIEATGLAWEPWRTVYYRENLPLVGSRTIKIGGTTLHPSVSEEITN
ncbi:thiol-activated cytolysin family protein [Streptomyces sp. NPDC008121]|uniref:thiol-activated cytolysin family protein n=1 Tax=Streptomyces sp. NPDC008121 TaxID=3364809 RepID=UPI0036ED196F